MFNSTSTLTQFSNGNLLKPNNLQISLYPNSPLLVSFTVKMPALNQTQATSLVQTGGANLISTIVPANYQNVNSSSTVHYNVTLLWDGSSMTSPQKISLAGYLPLSSTYFAYANLTVTLVPYPRCSYCGDGYVNFPEACEPAVNPCCNSNCSYPAGATCNNNTLITFTPISAVWNSPTGIGMFILLKAF